ncbi:MAG TPA: hypothetical protein PKE66_11015, partial [Pyrinomonadaceae bacterium]|nr:hypothetical protein [Pyrinomonadaceae bacterium]
AAEWERPPRSRLWNKLQTNVLSPRPLILVGECWRNVVANWEQELVVSSRDVGLLDFAANADEASSIILERSGVTR